MTFTLTSTGVATPDPTANVNASGTYEQRGKISCGEINLSSYTNGGEVIPAAALGLNKVYGAQFQTNGNDTYAVRSFEVAADKKSGTLNIDTAGTGTEVSAATNVGTCTFVAWGEALGSGTN